MRLYCTQSFRHGAFDVNAGETFEINVATGDWLLSSFPAYFRLAGDEQQAPDAPITEAPPADKQIKRAAKTK